MFLLHLGEPIACFQFPFIGFASPRFLEQYQRIIGADRVKINIFAVDVGRHGGSR